MNARMIFLIDKFERNSASEAELLELDDLYHSFENKVGYTALLTDREQYKEKLFERINQAVLAHELSLKKNKIKLWPRIATIAAAITIVLGIWFYTTAPTEENRQKYTYDIPPGKQGATLTLADGRKIRLNDSQQGELAKEAGVIIAKDADGKLVYGISGPLSSLGTGVAAGMTNTLSTANGQTYTVVLPDGSKVWLNASSSLTYSASLFANGARKVTLSGEAYFEVAKDSTHPFIVSTAKQQVEVLGTHFNVNAYPDDAAVKTTLLEGSVRVMPRSISGRDAKGSAVGKKDNRHNEVDPSLALGMTAVLKPGQQAILTGKLIVQNVDIRTAVDWKNGKFVFNDEPLTDIMKRIARWYDVTVEYQGVDPNERYGGSVSRFENVSAVLDKLALTGGIHFTLVNRKIIVTK